MMRHHLSDDDLDRYSLGRLAEPDLGRVEAHLLNCALCLIRVAETDAFVGALQTAMKQLRETPLCVTHFTDDGPVTLHVQAAEVGGWMASFEGQQLEGAKLFGTLAEANDHLLECFRLMFPDHVCGDRCAWPWAT